LFDLFEFEDNVQACCCRVKNYLYFSFDVQIAAATKKAQYFVYWYKMIGSKISINARLSIFCINLSKSKKKNKAETGNKSCSRSCQTVFRTTKKTVKRKGCNIKPPQQTKANQSKANTYNNKQLC